MDPFFYTVSIGMWGGCHQMGLAQKTRSRSLRKQPGCLIVLGSGGTSAGSQSSSGTYSDHIVPGHSQEELRPFSLSSRLVYVIKSRVGSEEES